MPASLRNIVVDAGPLAAAIDAGDAAHPWAKAVLLRLPGRYVTTEAALTEAVHLLQNDARAVAALARLVARMEVVPLAPARVAGALEAVREWAPAMDYADACAVLLARELPGAFVLTTVRRDFATYRVPFACPEGAFYE